MPQRKYDSQPLDDRVRLQHMLDAAHEAMGYVSGKDRSDLDSNKMLRRALKDCIQEIGEAATGVGQSFHARTPSIPWKQIVGMRHRIVHAYYDIDPDALWEVAIRDLPELVPAIEKALTSLDEK